MKLLCVKLLFVKFVCVSVCVCDMCGGGGGGGRQEEEEEEEAEQTRDTESKTRTPHKVVGKNLIIWSHTPVIL